MLGVEDEDTRLLEPSGLSSCGTFCLGASVFTEPFCSTSEGVLFSPEEAGEGFGKAEAKEERRERMAT